MSAGDRRRATIVGSGPAALVAAIALARRDWQVELRSRRERFAASRIDLLAASGLDALCRIGISRHDLAGVARPCPGTWSRWGAGGAVATDYLATPHGHGWSVERRRFEELLASRAVDLGVQIVVRTEQRDHWLAGEEPSASGDWGILASGGVSRNAGPGSDFDDRLVAVVATARLTGEAVDARLLIEAQPDGWAYGVAGPGDLYCFGVVTDAEALAGSRPDAFAMRTIAGTERIAAIAAATSNLEFRAVPLPCRWHSFRAGARLVRVGDAQASYDPIAGRGLWEAIRGAEAVAAAIESDPDQLDAIEDHSARRYRRYLADRRVFYSLGVERFGTGFWGRRCTPRPVTRAMQFA